LKGNKFIFIYVLNSCIHVKAASSNLEVIALFRGTLVYVKQFVVKAATTNTQDKQAACHLLDLFQIVLSNPIIRMRGLKI